MNYSNVKFYDISNGFGIRTSLFVSGCTHHCKGCFNRIAWDFDSGKPFDFFIQRQILDSLKPSYVQGLSILGGEPFEPQNQLALLPFLKQFKESFPQKDLWMWTGYTYQKDIPVTDATERILQICDVLVDGEFVESLKDISLQFRGSSNQRIIML